MSSRLAGQAKICLLWATLLGTVGLFVLFIGTYVKNGVAYPCTDHFLNDDRMSDPWHHHRYVTLPLVKLSITMFGALVVEFCSASAHLQLASWLGLTNWLLQVFLSTFFFLDCHRADASMDPGTSIWALSTGSQIMTFVCMVLSVYLFCKAVWERWLTLEIMSGGHRSGSWRRCFWSVPAYALLGASLFTAGAVLGLPFTVLLTAFFILTPPLFACFVWLAWPNLRLAAGASRAASGVASEKRAQRVQQAAKSVLLQFVGSLASGASTALYGLVIMLGLSVGDSVRLKLSTDIVSTLDVVCNTFLLLSLTGILSGAGRSARLRSRAVWERQGRWRRNREAWRQRGTEIEGEGEGEGQGEGKLKAEGEVEVGQLQRQWDEKVRELAGRGVSLDALLYFYRHTLPGLMPHFDPEKHSTGNIVFEAVIPYTCHKGCAAADLMMGGESVLPQTMVTHNWSNKFCDLLAAIVSHAIGESDFGMVAWLLVHDMDKLEAWIADRKVGSCTYWVCAFAVNQHISICGGRGQVCNCQREKCLNNSPPVMGDGSSIPCEVNKFDDMMRYLSAENPAFEQVVAVDAKCDLFWRAWCVAEIATAHETGMPQTLKVTSPDCLKANLEKFSELKIQDMHASRQEDKDLILGRIEDHENFNRTLRHTLLNEVIPAWNGLDASEQMSLAGCIIRWQRVSKQIGDPAMWAA